MPRATLPTALLLAFFVACGGDGSTDPAPTPSSVPTAVATASPRPTPGCGNGIIDDGEFCDGHDFCPANCSSAPSACCENDDSRNGGTYCGQVGFPSPQGCNSQFGRFSVGTTCTGSSCDEVNGVCNGDGQCASTPIEPVTICCQLDASCDEGTFTDTEALAQFTFIHCGRDSRGTPVVGVCGEAGICTKAPLTD